VTEDGVRVTARGGQRDLGSHERIAVAIAGDPATERHVQRDVQLLPEDFAERIVGGFTHLGRGVEQAIFEVPDDLAHFVEHARAVAPHLVRQPK
jgi:hypothetical protein